MYLAFIVGGLLFILLGDSRDFDERQQINRGKATYAAMWTFFSYAILAVICYEIFDYPILKSPSALLLIGFTLVMLVYLTISIAMDSYVPLNFPGIKYLYLVFGAVGIIAFLLNQRHTNIMFDGRDWMSLALGIVFLWSGLLMIVMKPIRKYLDSKIED